MSPIQRDGGLRSKVNSARIIDELPRGYSSVTSAWVAIGLPYDVCGILGREYYALEYKGYHPGEVRLPFGSVFISCISSASAVI